MSPSGRPRGSRQMTDSCDCFIVAWLMFWQRAHPSPVTAAPSERSQCGDGAVLWADDKPPLTRWEGPTATCSPALRALPSSLPLTIPHCLCVCVCVSIRSHHTPSPARLHNPQRHQDRSVMLLTRRPVELLQLLMVTDLQEPRAQVLMTLTPGTMASFCFWMCECVSVWVCECVSVCLSQRESECFLFIVASCLQWCRLSTTYVTFPPHDKQQ